jgi:site-specific DNA-methyltransferase (cytosine-N4-specific)
MKRLIARGYRAKNRPSGYKITHKFQRNLGGSIPSNVIDQSLPGFEAPEEASNWIARGNNESNSLYIRRCAETGQKVHPARFPAALPEFFVKLLTEEDDLIVDTFAGSNTTGWVSESLQRRWLTFELDSAYVKNSELRFGELLRSGR